MRLVEGRYSDILVMAWKWRFSPKWLRASGSYRSIRRDVILSVQIDYLLLSPLIFRAGVCIFQSHLSGVCSGLIRMIYRSFCRLLDSAGLSSLSINVGHTTGSVIVFSAFGLLGHTTVCISLVRQRRSYD